jgi:hypothetical protein
MNRTWAEPLRALGANRRLPGRACPALEVLRAADVHAVGLFGKH